MTTIFRGAVFVLALGLALPAWAAHPAPPAEVDTAEPNFWVGLGAGAYTASDYEHASDCCTNESTYNVGGYSGHLSFNIATDAFLVRIRHSALTDFTSNVAEETTIAAGLPLSPARNLWVTAGVSRLADVSDTRKSPTIGVPIEILGYPVRGLELMVHGNINGDKSFIGFGISGAIGRHRTR